MFFDAKSDILSSLLDITKIQITDSSNKIEGIVTAAVRLKEIVKQKAVPRKQSEKEIAGYRDVLETIHENYDYITPRANVILQLHRDLYEYSPSLSAALIKTQIILFWKQMLREIKTFAFNRYPPLKSRRQRSDFAIFSLRK